MISPLKDKDGFDSLLRPAVTGKVKLNSKCVIGVQRRARPEGGPAYLMRLCYVYRPCDTHMKQGDVMQSMVKG